LICTLENHSHFSKLFPRTIFQQQNKCSIFQNSKIFLKIHFSRRLFYEVLEIPAKFTVIRRLLIAQRRYENFNLTRKISGKIHRN